MDRFENNAKLTDVVIQYDLENSKTNKSGLGLFKNRLVHGEITVTEYNNLRKALEQKQ